jgi:hypothetical protein
MENHPSFLTYLVQAIEQYRADRQSKVAPEPGPTSKRSQRLVRWVLPNGGTLLIVLALLMTQSLWARPFAALNAPGPSATTVNYQGRLANNAGTPLDGTYGMSFALYDSAAGGTLIWGPEPHTAVPVSEGLFSVGLGTQTSGGIPTTVWNGDRYLEITVGGETLSPRELIRSVPIAGMALTVPDGAIGTTQIANGAIGANQIADGAIGTNQVADGAIGTNQVAEGAVTAVKLADRAVTSRKLDLDSGSLSGSSIALSSTRQDIPGLATTITADADLTVIAYATFDFVTDASTTAVGELWVDGSMRGRQAIQNNGRGTVAQTYHFSITPGTHTLQLRAYKVGTGTANVKDHSTLTWFVIQ